MSRLIVKNLPTGMKEDRFRTLFGAFGTLTDCSLKFTKEGKFRKFGFIGFSSEEEAQAALSHFNKAFIDTARVSVEFCKSFGDPTKAKAWSKHSQKQSSGKDTKEALATLDSTKDKKKAKATGALEALKDDKAFDEFLAVHQNRTQVATWTNDTLLDKPKKVKAKPTSDYLNFDSDSSGDISGDEEGSIAEQEEDGSCLKGSKESSTSASELTDMDYLKSKVVKSSPALEEREDDTSSSSSMSSEENEDDEENEKKGKDAQSSQECVVLQKEIKGHDLELKKKELKSKGVKTLTPNEPTILYTVKLRGAPFNVTEQNVREFLVPLRPAAIRIVKNAFGNKTGYIYVDFNSEEEVQKALKRSNDYMGGRYIEVFRDERSLETKSTQTAKDRPWQKREKKDDEEEEDVSESGRLFVRNLSYSCTEDDLQKMFSKYGPLSEIHFPIDSLTKKPKGFAFITFMIPEHAVKAYAEVDGQVFQGRMLHILPSTIKKDDGETDPTAAGSSTFKKKKASKDKASSASSHNWNTLFMGTSAVADAIAQKYNTTKSQVLDDEGRGSVAVRVALGETQLVQDVRQFLLDNGVSLDSFSQAAGERSKSVILAKNLPAGTKASEIQEVFGRHGDLGRVVLPEGGITAIVEFLEPTEAKRAFTKLAYSKFQHVPLYLEWAPMDVFSAPLSERKPQPEEKPQSHIDLDAVEEVEIMPSEASRKEDGDEDKDEDDEEDGIPGCTLFIKNLNFTTTEETLQTTFSKVGAVKKCTVSKKKDKSGALLSMGFGFVQYKKPEHAQKAIRQLQHCVVDEHQLEVKLSERAIKLATNSSRKKQTARKQLSSKILVRNIPFQASVREIRELFSTFGELKTVRLPKKVSGTGPHRGFGFVDFITKQDAKKAFSALCHSTHLYGRRLVLEWADAEDTVEALRRKTAEHFHDSPKKSKQSAKLDELLEKIAHEKDEDE
ncbi:probable RNA-binding protein 19 isoform X2 [Ambystoma mexicanum]|uniref:probable RNA-binding protein 19 isoform X2 n=1 Tax=Ambystoma mexicanum TaxID=8296 RepID=UPI0037E8161F